MIIESSQVIFDLEVSDIIAIKADFYVVCLYCFLILYKLKTKRTCQLSVSPLIGRILGMFIVENAQFSSCCFLPRGPSPNQNRILLQIMAFWGIIHNC